MSVINKTLIIVALFLLVPSAVASLTATTAWAASRCRAPTWFNGPETVTDGDHMIVRCTATAIVDEIAEMRATQTCENTAIAEVLIRAVKNRPARSATEVGPPADLAPPPCIVGLVCDSPRMRSCKSEDEVTIWRRCSYNMVAAHEGSKKECGVPPTAVNEATTVAEEPPASSTPPTSLAPAATPSSEVTPPVAAATEGAPSADVPPKPDAPPPPTSDFVLTVTTNPICDEIVIAGATERRYQCPSTLMEIPITAGDTTITVLARGYSDKLIPVESLSADHKLDVTLEALTSQ
ncbi:MAG: hypothetical protein FJ146_12765 [Deltaproteobacteria bacterium]|nr:hypothetical protein [Deltaproteobacteria bacterium]